MRNGIFSRFVLCGLYEKTSEGGLERRQVDGWAFWDMKAGSNAEDKKGLEVAGCAGGMKMRNTLWKNCFQILGVK